jgi:hypothetical protein
MMIRALCRLLTSTASDFQLPQPSIATILWLCRKQFAHMPKEGAMYLKAKGEEFLDAYPRVALNCFQTAHKIDPSNPDHLKMVEVAQRALVGVGF